MSARNALDRPNVIYVLCDDLGYGDIGCYGSARNATPTIDAMAREGLRLTDFYACPLCSPSRAALMTGCYPQRVGLGRGEDFIVLMPGDAIGLHPEEHTMPRLFHDNGYATRIIGKWHLGDQRAFLPQAHGFDDHFGLPYSNDMLPSHPDVGHRFPPLPLLRGGDVQEVEPMQQALTDRYLFDAERFIRDNRDRPFFLYLAHMYVHVPIRPARRFLREDGNGKYGAAVEHIDWGMGRLLSALDECGLRENTLIVFTSDNGACSAPGASNAPLRGLKGQAYEGGSRVPCVLHWPGTIAPACRSEIVSCMDMLPTFAALLGAALPGDRAIDGRDVSALLLRGDGCDAREELFTYTNDHLAAVRCGRYKYHADDGALYDLREDVGEARDLAGDLPDVAARLRARIDAMRAELGDRELGICGARCRAPGRVEAPEMLTSRERYGAYVDMEYD